MFKKPLIYNYFVFPEILKHSLKQISVVFEPYIGFNTTLFFLFLFLFLVPCFANESVDPVGGSTAVQQANWSAPPLLCPRCASRWIQLQDAVSAGEKHAALIV